MPEKKKRKPSLLKPGASSSYRPTKGPLGDALFEKLVVFVNEQIKSGPDDKNTLLTKGLHCLMIKQSGSTKEKLKLMDIDLEDLLSYLSNSGLSIGHNVRDPVRIEIPNPDEIIVASQRESRSSDIDQVTISKEENTSINRNENRPMKRKRF